MARNKFDVDEELQSEFNMDHLKRFLKYMKPHRVGIVLTVLLMIVSSIATLLGPYLIRDAIDNRIPEGDIRGLMIISSIFVGTMVISSVCLKFRIKMMSQIAQKIIARIRKDVFEHLQKLPFSYFDSRPHGKIIIRVVNYVNSLNELLQNGIINVITDLFSLGIIVIYMFIIDVRLTFISLVGLPVMATIIFLLKKIQRERWQKVSRKQSNMNAYLHESICGIKVTQSLAREEENQKIFNQCSEDCRSSWVSAAAINHLMWPISENISTLSISLLYVVGISWIGSGTAGITIGTVVAFVSYIGQFWAPIMNLANFYNQIIIAMAYLERIFETLDEPIVIRDAQEAYEMPTIKGEVVFDHVGFSYEKGQKILKDITFKVKPGETVALVGATGSGKTTIINLISRFYDIQEGEIRIDGHDISKVTLSSLRKQMGVMMQDSFIFSGNIMENIRYGRLDATDEQVIEAAKTVKAHDFIEGLEKGYFTEVNERGSRLSVGQRQLISFARALLADPKILILDEATSSIDTKTEKALQEGLERLLEGRTSFVIAHRLSTIKNADRIFYIDHGRIIETGSHKELIAKRGAYYRLFMAQYSMLNPDMAS